MTTADTVASDGMMDFSAQTKTVQFRIDNDVFTGVRDMMADSAFEFSAYATKLSDDDVSIDERKNVMRSMIRALLMPNSAELFIDRLSDPANPIGLMKCMDVIHWLFEQYGLRPTEPDSDSSSGPDSQDSGTNLTATTLGAE